MKKRLDNKGFSLVELVIVMAIMAVLIGILAPVYLQYVDRTEKTTDCTTMGAVLDSCQVLAADPNVTWNTGDKITIVINTNETGDETSYTGTGPCTELEGLVPLEETSLASDAWGPFTIEAVKDMEGHVVFDLDDDQINELAKYSTALSERLE